MKASKLGWMFSAAILVTMIGCGTNGDPGAKNYSEVKEKAKQPVSANGKTPDPTPTVQQPPAPPAPPPSFDCNNPANVSVEKDAGQNVMLFNAGEETTYKVKVVSKVGSDFKVDLDSSKLAPELSADLHAGRAKFQGKIEGSVGTFSFTWKPAKSDSLDFKLLPIRITPNKTAVCGASTENINLAVQPSAGKSGDAK